MTKINRADQLEGYDAVDDTFNQGCIPCELREKELDELCLSVNCTGEMRADFREVVFVKKQLDNSGKL
jgi:hypothetical protein